MESAKINPKNHQGAIYLGLPTYLLYLKFFGKMGEGGGWEDMPITKTCTVESNLRWTKTKVADKYLLYW